MMHWSSGMYGFEGHWPGVMIVMMLFWILVIVGLAALARLAFPQAGHGTHPAPESPEQILKRRYAKGEIDKAAFEERRRDIRES